MQGGGTIEVLWWHLAHPNLLETGPTLASPKFLVGLSPV